VLDDELMRQIIHAITANPELRRELAAALAGNEETDKS
jgi:hypothetical protein